MKGNVQSRLERLEGYKAGNPNALFFAEQITALGTVNEAGWTGGEGYHVARLSNETDGDLSKRVAAELFAKFSFTELFGQMIEAAPN